MSLTVKQIMPADGWHAVYAVPVWDEEEQSIGVGLDMHPLVGWALVLPDAGEIPSIGAGCNDAVVGMTRVGFAIQHVQQDMPSFLGYCMPAEDAPSIFGQSAHDWLIQELADQKKYGQLERWAKQRAGIALAQPPERPPHVWPHPHGETAPVLEAYSTGRNWEVWCIHCREWHRHGPVPGHRVAHCGENSPYKRTGYVLKLAGEMTDDIKNAARDDQGRPVSGRDPDIFTLRGRVSAVAASIYPLAEHQMEPLIAMTRREGGKKDTVNAIKVLSLLREAANLLHQIGQGDDRG